MPAATDRPFVPSRGFQANDWGTRTSSNASDSMDIRQIDISMDMHCNMDRFGIKMLG